MLGTVKRLLPRKLKVALRDCRTWVVERRLEKNSGYCVICEADTVFLIHDPWLRDFYKCRRCKTIPRNRALINALNRFVPEWRTLSIHESSPGSVTSRFLNRSCSGYSTSHYYPDVPRGEYSGQHRSEDLSALTFPDHSFDVFITADVFEHVYKPAQAFSEIARVLKPGGMHIFTMPWYPENKETLQRAQLNADGSVSHLVDAVYHESPIDDEGSLVTFDWGSDFTDFIYAKSGLVTTVYLEIDRSKGLDAKFLEVFISRKSSIG